MAISRRDSILVDVTVVVLLDLRKRIFVRCTFGNGQDITMQQERTRVQGTLQSVRTIHDSSRVETANLGRMLAIFL